MTTPDRLVSRVRAALDEREAHAQKDLWAADQATPGDWRVRYGVNLPQSWVETESTPIARLDAARHEGDGLLIARFKPDNVRKRAAAVLRLVASLRDIVALHSPERRRVTFAGDEGSTNWGEVVCIACYSAEVRRDFDPSFPCPTVRALAHGLGIDLEETPE